MKHRWTGTILLTATITLAACAPQQGGGDASTEPSETAAPASIQPEPMSSAEPSLDATEGPTEAERTDPPPDDAYDY